MNILPKKNWHVRTKDNIARVRKDEAEAAEKQRKLQNQVNKAEQEARINYLRSTCDAKNGNTLCAQIAAKLDVLNVADSAFSNKEYEKEQKFEKEKYEKQIGYLTYVGQHRNLPNLKRWYEIAPKRYNNEGIINKYSNKLKDPCPSEVKPKKNLRTHCLKSKYKSPNFDKVSLMDLRKKRLIREANEKIRTNNMK